MATIIRVDCLRVVIWPNDHRPAHVHAVGAEGEAVFLLNCPDGLPTSRESFGCRMPEVNRIEGLLVAKVATLCAAWSETHGRY